MSDTPFQTFIALIAIDQKINALNKEGATHEAEFISLAQQRMRIDQSLAEAKKHLHDVQKEVDARELEMKDLAEKEQTKKRQLDQLTSHKEYPPIKSEIDFLKKQQHELEESLIQSWNTLENAKKEYAHQVAQHEVKAAESARLNMAIEEKKKLLHDELEKLRIDREPLHTLLPDEWMQKYNAMRARVSDPVVPVMQKNCTACFYPLSEQDFIAVSHRRLIQCKGCFRLLYLPEVQPQNPPA